jgi:hypothetical protein
MCLHQPGNRQAASGYCIDDTPDCALCRGVISCLISERSKINDAIQSPAPLFGRVETHDH